MNKSQKYPLAPIGINVYSRLYHLKKTVDALLNNDLAKDSIVYFFSDGPKAGDEKAVSEIRSYLKTVKGFKSKFIIERLTNHNENNGRNGILHLLEIYGKVIWMAEDIVTAPGFLSYMNGALNFYENDKRIFSISGWSPIVKLPKNYNNDTFIVYRFNPWGFATWKDRFDSIRDIIWNKISQEEFQILLQNTEQLQKMDNTMGRDFIQRLKNRMSKEGTIFDIMVMCRQFLTNRFTLMPAKALAHHIGYDGSGVNRSLHRFFHVELDMNKKAFIFEEKIKPNNEIVKQSKIPYELHYFEFQSIPNK